MSLHLAGRPVEWYLEPREACIHPLERRRFGRSLSRRTNPPHAALVELHEVGFLLGENDEAVVIGMEFNQDAEIQPGRWRLHIPRVSIQEMRVVELDKAFPKRRKK